MNNEDIVCKCSDVTVVDVIDGLDRIHNENLQLSESEILEELAIGLNCECCLDKDCDIIDIHYSKLIKKI
jgi:hypothetical protein